MTTNKASVIFPVTNLSVWIFVSISFLWVYNGMVGVVFFPVVFVFVLNFGLVKLTKKVPYDKLKGPNVVASALMLIIVIPLVFMNIALAGVLFLVLLLGGVFYILLMTNTYHGNFIVRRSVPHSTYKFSDGGVPVSSDSHHKNGITAGHGSYSYSSNGFNNTKSLGGINFANELPVAISLLGINEISHSKGNSSVNYNPANGLPLMDASFDVLGNVNGSSGTHNAITNNDTNSRGMLGSDAIEHYSPGTNMSQDYSENSMSSDIYTGSHYIDPY